MSRSTRLLELTQLLAGRRARTLADIVDRFGVSERTAYRDLAALSQAVPVTRDEHGYRLLDTATIKPLSLTGEEQALLRVALASPALARRAPLARVLELLSAKLEKALAAAEESSGALQLAGLDRSGAAADAALPVLRDAATARRTVEIEYRSLSGGSHRRRRLDPWRVFERAEAWYVVGRCRESGEPRIFRLDRITAAAPTAGTFPAPAGFDLDAFLAGAWGVFVGAAEHDIALVFAPRLAALVEQARHHDGETVERLPDGAVRYRVRLSSLEEIARWIVGFGGGVRVEAPGELRDLVREIARGALAAAE